MIPLSDIEFNIEQLTNGKRKKARSQLAKGASKIWTVYDITQSNRVILEVRSYPKLSGLKMVIRVFCNPTNKTVFSFASVGGGGYCRESTAFAICLESMGISWNDGIFGRGLPDELIGQLGKAMGYSKILVSPIAARWA